MKNLKELDKYRIEHPLLGKGDDEGGCFYLPTMRLLIIASMGEGWDHVSVSLKHRCPTWDEMEYVKRLFFEPDEVALQLHPARNNYINMMPFCLHMWRPQKETILMPPAWMVAP